MHLIRAERLAIGGAAHYGRMRCERSGTPRSGARADRFAIDACDRVAAHPAFATRSFDADHEVARPRSALIGPSQPVAMISGTFHGSSAADSEARSDLLGPIVAQNDAIGQAARGRRTVTDVNPDTGVPSPTVAPQVDPHPKV